MLIPACPVFYYTTIQEAIRVANSYSIDSGKSCGVYAHDAYFKIADLVEGEFISCDGEKVDSKKVRYIVEKREFNE